MIGWGCFRVWLLECLFLSSNQFEAGELVDNDFDSEDADINKLLEDLKGELMDNSFLSKMFQQEQEKQDKEQTKQEKVKAEN